MPAKSKSQQRLFGMVHAYNKGELSGSPALKRRVAAVAKHISRDDARDFAATRHKDLPETKKAQVTLTPAQVQSLYQHVPPSSLVPYITPRSRRRRTFLGSVIRGSVAGTVMGGVGFGALGAFLAHRAGSGAPGVDADTLRKQVLNAGLKTGIWGATRGAGLGAISGGGLHIWSKLKGADR